MWVLETDIKGFFDHMNHDWLLKNIPMDKHVLREWLKAGVLEAGNLTETTEGVPQGGPISRIIANMCLDGLEPHIKNIIKETHDPKWAPKMTIVRYADDVVVTGTTPRLLMFKIKPAIEQYLAERGLSLHPEKTQLTKVQDGFDFVGHNFRLYEYNKKSRGYTFLVKPSKKSIFNIKSKIKKLFEEGAAWDAFKLICKLNPVLRGWAYFQQPVVSKEVFGMIDMYLWKKSWKWVTKKHPKGSRKALKEKYFQTLGGRNWVFFGVEKPQIE